jgi:hypothetical protein
MAPAVPRQIAASHVRLAESRDFCRRTPAAANAFVSARFAEFCGLLRSTLFGLTCEAFEGALEVFKEGWAPSLRVFGQFLVMRRWDHVSVPSTLPWQPAGGLDKARKLEPGGEAQMTTSKYIARLMGPVLLAMGLGMIVEHETMRALAQEFLTNRGLIYLSGILTLLAGLAIVNAHNLWVPDWRVIITIMGWLGIAGGLFRILLTGQVQAIGTGLAGNTAAIVLGGLGVLAVGGVLAYNGYEDLWEAKPQRRAAPASRGRSRARSAGAKRPRRKRA